MKSLAECTEGLTPKKRQLLEMLLKEKRSKKQAKKKSAAPLKALKHTLPRIAARTGAEPLPLSFGQERLWLLQQLDPERAAYRIPAAVRLRKLRS